MKHKEIDTAAERRITTGISFYFMLLVGLSMPLVTERRATRPPQRRSPARSP